MDKNVKTLHTYKRGLIGQDTVEKALIANGYTLYAKNMKKIDFECDLIVYKYNKIENNVDIRIVEVKSRKNLNIYNQYQSDVDLEYLGLHKKWNKIKPYMYIIANKLIQDVYKKYVPCKVHFDLAVVSIKDMYSQNKGHTGEVVDIRLKIHRYIQDVNLLL